MTAPIVTTSAFLCAALLAGLWNQARRGKCPIPALEAASAGALAVAIGGPGSGLVDGLLRLPWGPAIGDMVPPFLPHVAAVMLSIWAATRFIPAAAGMQSGAAGQRGERASTAIMLVSLVVVGPLYLLSLRPGLEATAWSAIIMFAWLTSMVTSIVCLLAVTHFLRELWADKAWHVFSGLGGAYLFAGASAMCVADPRSLKLQVIAFIGIMLMLFAAAYARGYGNRQVIEAP